jgi:hypothetical protein
MPPSMGTDTARDTGHQEIKPSRSPKRIVVTFRSGDELEVTDQDNLRIITDTGSYEKPGLSRVLSGLLDKTIKWILLVNTNIKVKTKSNEWDDPEFRDLTGDVYWPTTGISEIIVL